MSLCVNLCQIKIIDMGILRKAKCLDLVVKVEEMAEENSNLNFEVLQALHEGIGNALEVFEQAK